MAKRKKDSAPKRSATAKKPSSARGRGPVKKSDAARKSGPVKKSSAARKSGPVKKSSAARKSGPVKKSSAAKKATRAKATRTGQKAAARAARPARASRPAPKRRAPESPATATSAPSAARKAQSLIRKVQDAVDEARTWLGQRGDYYTFLSRSDTLRGAPELGRHLRGDLLAKQRNGSWGDGNLASTAEAIWLLLDLGTSADFPPFARGLEWLFGRLDAEGSYASGCTPSRHEHRICEHFLSGFFSPGHPNEPLEISLPNGQSVSADATARLLVSERTLRSVLRANPRDPRVAAPISGLTSLPLYGDYGESFTPPALVGAVQALAWSAGQDAGKLEAGLLILAAAQQKDGTWPNVEFFFVLEALLETRHPLADAMLKRAVPRLLEVRHKNGTWGRRQIATQTWIAIQVLERAVQQELAVRTGPV